MTISPGLPSLALGAARQTREILSQGRPAPTALPIPFTYLTGVAVAILPLSCYALAGRPPITLARA